MSIIFLITSVTTREEPMEQEDTMLEEVQAEDPGHILACNGRDIFCLKEDDLTNSQLVVTVNTAEVESALQPVYIPCWVLESEQDSSIGPSSEVQDKGLVDPSSLFHLLSLPLVREALGRSLSSGPASQSLVTKFRSMSWKLNAELAIRLPWTASLVMAPNPKR